MKIGIITPTNKADPDIEYPLLPGNTLAIAVLVGDGVEVNIPRAPYGWNNIEPHTISLPSGAHNAGATPREIGSSYAIGQGVDALFFLDEGNRFSDDHIPNAIAAAAQGAEIVTSLRWMVDPDGHEMFVDAGDSDGLAFADTNTIALFGRAVVFGTTWAWFAQPSGTDRIFWDRLRKSFGAQKIANTGAPTVLYQTRWAAHYNHVDEHGKPRWQAPSPAKFVTLNADGERIALEAVPVWSEEHRQWVPEGYEVKP